MVLDRFVVRDCLGLAGPGAEARAAVIPEVSVGTGFWAECRRLERSCYTNDEVAEAARFFEKKLFEKLGEYDENLTGPEDIDLSVRAEAFVSLPRTDAKIIHDEGKVGLRDSFLKKRYYARTAHHFMVKHPLRAVQQGNM